jgi:hypothetical protein
VKLFVNSCIHSDLNLLVDQLALFENSLFTPTKYYTTDFLVEDLGTTQQDTMDTCTYPHYDGSEDPSKWINCVKALMNINKVRADEQVSLLAVLLDGSADTWYGAMGDPAWTTDQFGDALITKFDPESNGDPLESLWLLSREPDESLVDYTNRFCGLVKKIQTKTMGVEEALMLWAYARGLANDRLKEAYLSSDITSI